MTAGLTRSLRASSLSLGVLCLTTLAVRAETPLERGTYLMQSIVACGNCHTPKDRDGKPIADREFAGGFVIDAPVFHSVSPNITPDKETGIGNWTDDQIVNAIRNGKRPDGTTIGPLMPIAYYRNLSGCDVSCALALSHASYFTRRIFIRDKFWDPATRSSASATSASSTCA